MSRAQDQELCEHLREVTLEDMPRGGCIDCLAIGGTWVHLRYCTTCKQTRCCDDSPNRHASKHAAAQDHPVVRSKEPGENWAWCYAHQLGVEFTP